MIKSGDSQVFTLDTTVSRSLLSLVDSEREEPKYECKKGWLLSSTKDGDQVPFFLYTRSQDIHWDYDGLKEVIEDIFGNNHLSVIDTKVYIPGASLKIHYGTWDCTIDLGLREIRLSKRINIVEFFEMVDRNRFTYTTTFPIGLINNGDFIISHTMSGRNIQLSESHVNITPIEENEGIIKKLKLDLTNYTYPYHEDYSIMEEYRNSYIYIHVKGRTNVF